MSDTPEVTYIPLKSIDEFWADKKAPATEQDFADFETKYGMKIPLLLKSLFRISNGGRTNYSCVKIGDNYFGYFPEWIQPIKTWEPFADYVSDFGLDDDDTLDFLKKDSAGVICYRHGFDVFSLFWNSVNLGGSLIGCVDLNAQPHEYDYFVKGEVSNDPVGVFFEPHYKSI